MYIRAKQLAQELGVTVKTIYNLMNTGQLPQGVKFGKSRRWDMDEIKTFIKQRSCKNI